MKFITYKGIQVPIDPPPLHTGALVGMKAGDAIAGINSGVVYEVVLPNYDWRDLIFVPDQQFFPWGDTWACTNFAPSNERKLQLKQASGIEYDFSERANAELSGTKVGVGNYTQNDPAWCSKHGCILNADWPNQDGTTQALWEAPVPLEVQKKAVHFNESYEFVGTNTEALKYHLKQAPVTVVIDYGSTQHDICAVYIDDNGVWYMDSYPHDGVSFLAITTKPILSALKIVTKHMNTIYFVHNTTRPGEYGLMAVSPVSQNYLAASTEADLKARGGTSVPLTSDGKIDYSKAIDKALF